MPEPSPIPTRPWPSAALVRSALLGLVLALLQLTSCGSGAIAGIVAGNNNSGGGASTPGVQSPALEIPNNRAPIFLLGSDIELRALTVRNVELRPPYSTQRIEVQLITEDPAIVEVQPTISISNVESDRFTVSFQVLTTSFLQYFSGQPKRDLAARLRVLLDGAPAAPDGAFELLQPPQVDLVVGSAPTGEVEVSVDGSSRVTLELSQLQARDGDDISMRVFQRNPLVGATEPDAIRVLEAEQLSFVCLETDPNSGLCTRARVSVIAPPSKFPGVNVLYVRDREAGWQDLSAPVRLLYAPVLSRISPDSASVDGGVPAVLLGTGLLPARNDTGTIEYLYDDIKLTLEKGGARLELDASAIRRELSNDQQIFFRLPRSPDGLPGEAKITIQQRFADDIERRVSRSLGLGSPGQRGPSFAIDTPQLTHRISPLLRESEELRSGAFFPGGLGGEELVLLSRGSEYGQVAMQRAAGIGVYREAGRPINVVGQRLETGRNPLHLLVGSFSAAQANELFVVSGSGAIAPGVGEHARLATTSTIDTPLAVFDSGIAAEKRILASQSADVDRDGVSDLILLRQAVGGDSDVLVLRDLPGGPLRLQLDLSPGQSFELLHVLDIDGDGAIDIACATAAAPWLLELRLGDGLGGFSSPQLLSFEPSANFFGSGSRGMALESAGSPAQRQRHLYVILGRVQATARQWVLPLRFDPSLRMLLAPDAMQALELPGTLPDLRCSITLDLIQGGAEELVLGTAGGSSAALLGLELTGPVPRILPSGAVPAEVEMRNVRALRSASIWNAGGERGLVVLHDELSDEQLQPVVSVLPLRSDRLLSRRTRLDPASMARPGATLLGDLDQDGLRADLALATSTELEIYSDRRFGLYTEEPSKRLPAPGMIPQSVVALKADGSQLAWLLDTGELVFFDSTTQTQLRRDVREYLEAGAQQGKLDTSSRLSVEDYDFDGDLDLCLWLVPANAGPGASAALVALRRIAAPASQLPFARTDPQNGVQRVPAPFSGLFTASILPHDLAYPGVEAAVLGQRIVVFFTLLVGVQAEDDRFVYVPEILSDLRLDSDPRQLLFTSFGEEEASEGLEKDMAVLAGGRIRFYRNAFGRQGDVLLGRFEPLSDFAYPGEALALAAGEFNGDGIGDFLVLTERGGSTPGPVLSLFAGLGSGSYRSAYVYSALWQVPVYYGTLRVADLDGNGLDDVILGREVLFSR